MQYIAVKDFELQILADGSDVTTPNPTAVTIQTQPNDNGKIDGKAIYCGQVKARMAGLVVQGHTQISPTVFTFILTAKYNKLDGELVLLETDTTEQQSIACKLGNHIISPTVKLVVKKAGQTTVKGD